MKQFNHVESKKLLELDKIENENGRFYISPSGMKLPSITTILGSFEKDGLQDWRNRIGEEEAEKIVKKAGVRGQKYHDLVERYIRNDHTDITKGLMPDMKQMFNLARKKLDHIDNVRYIEATLFSEKMGTAGRCDLIADYDNVLSIIDHKTSRSRKKKEWISHYFEQCAGYGQMFYEMTGTQIEQVVIILVDDFGNVDAYVEPIDKYLQNLLEKIALYRKENNVL